MLKNYLKTAWRSITKNKAFSLINIAGLSIGMAACLLIVQYVCFELSFDSFNKNSADLYRITNDRFQNGKLIQHGTITYSAVGKALQDDYPEIVNHARVRPQGPDIFINGEKKLGEKTGFAVDNSFLSMFSYTLIAGNKTNALTEPNSIVLTEKLARQLFGDNTNYHEILGKSIKRNNETTYKITGICEDPPENSHLQFSYLSSYITLYSGQYAWKAADYSFTASDFWHYVQLKPGTNYKTLEAKLPAFSQRHFDGNKISGSEEQFFLQPLRKAHLYADYEYEIGKTGSATVVWGLMLIASLIIIIAWVNYINLATAKSTERAKEVGVRKVAGATKLQLIKQFITESVLINLTALAMAVLFVLLVQPSFNQLIARHLNLSFLLRSNISGINVSVLLGLLIIAGIIVSGFYPAFVLSSFKPILVLKGKFIASAKGINLRKALVIGQFAITVALIIGSFVVYSQMQYLSKQKLGIDISQVLVIKPPQLTQWDSTFISKENSLHQEIKKIPHVLGVANSWNVAGNELGRDFDLSRSSATDAPHYTTRKMGISPDFIDVYSITLLAGRKLEGADYNPEWQKVHNLIINERVCKLLAFTSADDAVGKQLHVEGRTWDIVGVIADFHQKSLRYPLEPMLLMPNYSTYSPLSVKIEATDLPVTLAAIKARYDAFFTGNLFDCYFLDDSFNQQYANDQLFGKVFTIFAGFAIFIACLGLLGLSLFATAQRTKEIGIRKVLGASVSSVVMLLSKDFIRLIIVAFVIASPIAWYTMHGWLNDFAYRIDLSLWIFAAAGSLALVIALATISFQAIKAALANPVKSLRTE